MSKPVMNKSEMRELVQRWAKDPYIEHDVETCGHCHKEKLKADAMAEVLEMNPAPENLLEAGLDLMKKKWQESKFFKLWQEERAAGREPEKAFAERGWEP